MLPTAEINTLLTTVTDALDFATEGAVVDGYHYLLAGLRRAEGIADEGEPWAPELVARWRQALDSYAARYQVGRA